MLYINKVSTVLRGGSALPWKLTYLSAQGLNDAVAFWEGGTKADSSSLFHVQIIPLVLERIHLSNVSNVFLK